MGNSPAITAGKATAEDASGRKPLDDRRVLTDILFVLQSGIPWEMMPQEMGCGSGMVCWRRVRAWQKAGVWRKLHRVLLDRRLRVRYERLPSIPEAWRFLKSRGPFQSQPLDAPGRPEAGWMYLAVVIGLFSRKGVAWAMAPSLNASS